MNVRAHFRVGRSRGRGDNADVNLLVVDDQLQMRETIRSMLKANGYANLLQAENGVEALRVIRSKPVDLVITDWNMPNMTGIELLKTIRADVELFSKPVLMVSDEASSEKVLYAIEEGVNGFVMKPFCEMEFIKRLRHVLDLVAKPSALQRKLHEIRRLKLSNKYSEALQLGLEILDAQNHPVVSLMVCECLYHLKDYDRAIQMISDTEEGDRTSQHASLLGKVFMGLGKRDDAVLYLEQAVKKNPVNDERKIDLAWAFFSTGNVAGAEKLIGDVMKANPTDLNLVAIGKLYLQRDEVDKAGQYLDHTVNPIPETVHVYNEYAIALRKAERYEDSIRIYRKCLRITPDSDVLYYNLGFLCNFIGDHEGAKEALENAVKLNPHNEHARRLLTKVGPRPHGSG